MNWRALFLAILSISMLQGCGDSAEPGTATSTGEPVEAVEPVEVVPTMFAIGEPVDLGDGFSSTIALVKTQPTAGAIIANSEVYLTRAGEGMTFVVVEYTVTNNGAAEEYFLFAPQLADASGAIVDSNIDASTNYTVHELVRTEPEEASVNFNSTSTYSPGEYKTKATVFEVDQAAWDAGGWTLVMEEAGVVTVN